MKTIKRFIYVAIFLFLMLNSVLPAFGTHLTSGTPPGKGELGPYQLNALVPPLTCPAAGAPTWSVNMVNANLYVTDIPLWYEPAIGPSVRIRLHYNSRDNSNWIGLFGRGIRFNYGYSSRFNINKLYPLIYIPPAPNGAASKQKHDKDDFFAFNLLSLAWAVDSVATETPPPPEDHALVMLEDSRIIEFSDETYAEGPRTIAVKDGFTQFYGVLNKLDDTHYTLQRTNGETISYTRLTESIPWYNLFASGGYNYSQITAIKDRYGHQLTLEHDGIRPTRIIDAEGRSTQITYNAQGLIERIADPFGRFATFEYNDQLCLTKITDMNGYWTELDWDIPYTGFEPHGNLNLVAIRNSQGETRFKHEPGGYGSPGLVQPAYPAPDAIMFNSFRLTVTHPDNAKEEFFYCGLHGYGWHVAPEYYMEYIDKENNNYASEVPKTLYYFATTAKGMREQVQSVFSPEGHTQLYYNYDYDTQNITAIANGLNNRYQYTYNDKGRIASVTNPLNHVTNYEYGDNQLDVTRISSNLGAIEFDYNANRDLIAIRDQRELTATTGDTPTGFGTRETLMTYNSNGQLTHITDPDNRQTQLIYNTANRLGAIQQSAQQVASFSYDPIGRVISATDATGLTLNYTYDNLNRVTRIAFPDGGEQIFSYSGCCPWLMDSITERGGRTTFYTYDARKNLTRITLPGQKTIAFNYDTNNNLVELIDQNSHKTRFEYDLADRLIKKKYHDGSAVLFEYDAADRLARYTNARGIHADYDYNARGDILFVSHSDGTPGMNVTYDAYGRVARIADGIGQHQFTRYLNSTIKSVDGPWSDDTITYQYDRLDRVTQVQAQGGTAVSYVYDTLDRLTTITSSDQTHHYTYTSVNPLVQSLTRPNGSATQYEYDSLNRLTQVTHQDATQALISRYTYTRNAQDAIENETIQSAESPVAPAEGVQTYNYNALNQLLSKTSPDQGFEYDADGNLVKGYTPAGDIFTAQYDAENQLSVIEYTDSEGIAHESRFQYDYNGFLARVQTYVNHVPAPAADLRILRNGLVALQDRDGNNHTIRQYTWGLNLGGGIGGLLAMRQDGTNYQYLYDGKGNVTAVLDTANQTVASYRYDVFGKLLRQSGTLEQPFTFSTKRYFAQLGLNYYGYRYYQPAVGRWLTRDPLQEAGGLNLYGFVQNNPVNWIDPMGLNPALFWRILTPFARYLPYVPAIQKVAQDVFDPGPGVYSSYEELKKRYDARKAKQLYELQQTIKFEEQFYRDEFDACLARGGKDCLDKFYEKYDKYVSPMKRRLCEMTH